MSDEQLDSKEIENQGPSLQHEQEEQDIQYEKEEQYNEEPIDEEDAPKKSPPKLKHLDITQGNIVIEVAETTTKEEKFGKHTLYKIKGSDENGSYEVWRRYSDFDKIRAVFITRWPGVYIPPLPPKKTVNNMESKFIEERRKALDQFCKKIAERLYLYSSEEFSVFTKANNPDIEKVLSGMQKLNSEDIVSKYLSSFPYLENKGEIEKYASSKIINFKLFLSKAKGYLENVRKASKGIVAAKKNYYAQLAIFQEQVCGPYEKTVYSNYHGNDDSKNVFGEANNTRLNEAIGKLKESSLQSYEEIYEYIEEETREIDALIEAIEQRDRIEALRNKAREKEKSGTNDLNKVQAGKKTMKTLFSKKSKDDEVAGFEKNIANAAKDVENFSVLLDMITLILSQDEIPKFKNIKLHEYYKILGVSGNNELANLTKVAEYWETIMSNENIKALPENKI